MTKKIPVKPRRFSDSACQMSRMTIPAMLIRLPKPRKKSRIFWAKVQKSTSFDRSGKD
jgi:hypothetical protein